MEKLPQLTSDDTLIFLGDYLDRGPQSAAVVDYLMKLPERCPAKVVTLRGNHEDGWLQVIDEGWENFVVTPRIGALATLRSYLGEPAPSQGEAPNMRELAALYDGGFFPSEVVDWLRSLPFWYEDDNGIYVHGCLPIEKDGRFPHPSQVEPQATLAWCREARFFSEYDGKRTVVGHTLVTCLPQEESEHMPHDRTDMYQRGGAFALDTGAGLGGFLTALELPRVAVYESR